MKCFILYLVLVLGFCFCFFLLCFCFFFCFSLIEFLSVFPVFGSLGLFDVLRDAQSCFFVSFFFIRR